MKDDATLQADSVHVMGAGTPLEVPSALAGPALNVSEPVPEKFLNRCTVERREGDGGYVQVIINENEARAEDVAMACRNAMLGLGFTAEFVDSFIPNV